MDKKNYLAIIPLYGSVILIIWMYIKMIRQEISMKRFVAYLSSSAIVGFVSILISILLFKFISSFLASNIFINDYGLIAGFILGGYLLNLFTFTLVKRD